MHFLRNLILDGQWEDADIFIKTIFEKSLGNTDDASDNGYGEAMNQINYQIKKEIYLELLFTNDLENNQNYVVELVKEMEALSPSKEAHFELCNLLNYPRLQNHPEYADWNISIGRFDCFNFVKNILSEIPNIRIGVDQNGGVELRRAPSGRLSKLLQDSVLY